MANVYPAIDEPIRTWIGRQHVYFVATAPLSGDGLVNCSPKGGANTLCVVDDHTLAYLDFIGSGIETVAHLRENGRVVIMFCALEGLPRIFRFHGRGDVVPPTHPDFAALAARFDHDLKGLRSIIRINVERISDSCGFGVPVYEFKQERTILPDKYATVPAEDLKAYVAGNNTASLDGLPALTETEAATVSPTR